LQNQRLIRALKKLRKNLCRRHAGLGSWPIVFRALATQT
jgi:hypothetical protein